MIDRFLYMTRKIRKWDSNLLSAISIWMLAIGHFSTVFADNGKFSVMQSWNYYLLIIFLLVIVGGMLLRYQNKALLNEYVLREALNQSNQGIALLDSTGRIVFWNSRLEAMTGITTNMVMKRMLSEISLFSDDHPIVKMLPGAISQPLEHSLKFRTQLSHSSSKESFPVIVNLGRFSIGNPDQFVILLTILDIREAEELRNRLQKALTEAESSVKKMTELDRLKSEFLAICSHELKTPLVSITGYLDLIASGKMGQITEKQHNALQISIRNAAQLNKLLSSLLDFARMEAGKIRFDFTPQKLSVMIEEAAAVFLPMTGSKHIKISLDVSDDLPHVYMDTALLNRVFLNLFDNAVKFTPANGEIQVKARETENQVSVEIIDNGIGINEKDLERVKEPFFQADASDTRKTGGLGLGLAIVEKILGGHGSKLEIENNATRGTTMRFFLKKARRSSSGKFTAMETL